LFPYSPLGRGFLTGKIKDTRELSEDDFRRQFASIRGRESAPKPGYCRKSRNVGGGEKGATPGQIALAVDPAQRARTFVRSLGTSRVKHLKENAAAVYINYPREEMAALDGLSAQVQRRAAIVSSKMAR